MTKSRRLMTVDEIKEQEYWRDLRATKNPDLRFGMMLRHALRQCEVMHGEERCPNKHGELGVTVKGRVILTPRNGGKPYLHCQKCGFDEVKRELEKGVHFKGTKPKAKPFQVEMFS
jgi:hypothetical protein